MRNGNDHYDIEPSRVISINIPGYNPVVTLLRRQAKRIRKNKKAASDRAKANAHESATRKRMLAEQEQMVEEFNASLALRTSRSSSDPDDDENQVAQASFDPNDLAWQDTVVQEPSED